MKKLAVLMGLVLVMALALPAAAGINTDITGKVQTDLYYNSEDGFWGFGKVETKVTMSAGTEGAIKAVLGLGSTESNKDGEFGDNDSPLKVSNPINLAVDTAYIEANGAWIEGTPDVTTKIGRFGANYNDWVAELGDKDGVEFSNIELGPLAVTGFYGWVNTSPGNNDHPVTTPGNIDPGTPGPDGTVYDDWRIAAVSAKANLDVVELAAAYVSTLNLTDEDKAFSDYVVQASVTPAEGVKLDAAFANDGYHEATGYKVSGELSPIANLKLGVSYWALDQAFYPVYAKLDDKKAVAFAHEPDERHGLEVKANTTQAGFDLGVTLKNTSDADGTEASKATSYELSASRDFGGFKGTYKYSNTVYADDAKNDAKDDEKFAIHAFIVETTVDTPIAKAVNLKGTVRLHEVHDLQYAADATWRAPNGFNIGVHYASWDRTDKWGTDGWDVEDVNKANKGKADGFTFRTGYSIEF